jgi:hypothetical protein
MHISIEAVRCPILAGASSQGMLHREVRSRHADLFLPRFSSRSFSTEDECHEVEICLIFAHPTEVHASESGRLSIWSRPGDGLGRWTVVRALALNAGDTGARVMFVTRRLPIASNKCNNANQATTPAIHVSCLSTAAMTSLGESSVGSIPIPDIAALQSHLLQVCFFSTRLR